MNRILSYLLAACFVLVLFSCQKEYSFENETQVPAAGSLWDSTGVCLPSSVYGTFYGGVQPGSDTAFVEVQVNVTQTGSYTISSDLQDGFYFADSGFFSATGLNTIRLKPVGIPIIPTTSTFTITFDSTFCSFDVVVQDSTGIGLGGGPIEEDDLTGNWAFTTADGTFTGFFDTAAIFVDTTVWLSGDKMLVLAGPVSSLGDSILSLVMYLPNGVITPGTTYKTSLLPPEHAAIFAFSVATTGDGIYVAVPDSVNSEVTVNIDTYDTNTQIVTGTFSGTALDEDLAPNVTVTSGSFSVKVDQ